MDKELKDYFGCLSAKKTRSKDARRRFLTEDRDYQILDARSPYAVDAKQKLWPSKALRRLDSKTQVFSFSGNSHRRTRLTHTLETANVATLIARILGLNEELCEAIAFGHDIGHVPFGHAGEDFMSKVIGHEFRHEAFGVVIAQHVERQGEGLNLTYQALDGILRHSRGSLVMTLDEQASQEANVVMFSDKIAYVWSDINDIFFKGQALNIADFPKLKKLVEKCGQNQCERTFFCAKALCLESARKGHVSFSDCVAAQLFEQTKKEMYGVYDQVNLQNASDLLEKVYDLLCKVKVLRGADPKLVMALMTDNDVMALAEKSAVNAEDFYNTSVAEMIPCLKDKKIDLTDPDLGW